jgi:hypothetical protein
VLILKQQIVYSGGLIGELLQQGAGGGAASGVALLAGEPLSAAAGGAWVSVFDPDA